jgi:hypothetical protein
MNAKIETVLQVAIAAMAFAISLMVVGTALVA